MKVEDLTAAARNMLLYLEDRGEDANLDVVAAQLQLMKDRLRLIRVEKHGKTLLELVKR